MTDAVKTLARIELFQPLTEAQRDSLNRQCRWRRVGAQEQIIDRHDAARDVFFIVEGRVRVANYSMSGREISFDDLEAGSFFGELSALDGRPRSANVMALTDTLLAVMPAAVFCRAVSEHPELAIALMRHLVVVVRRSNERIMDLSTLGANNRVHAEVLRLARASGKDDNTAVIAPIPPHNDIAGRVSTTRETVARVFGDLARAGIVERQANHLLVRDLARLEELVEDVRGDL